MVVSTDEHKSSGSGESTTTPLYKPSLPRDSIYLEQLLNAVRLESVQHVGKVGSALVLSRNTLRDYPKAVLPQR